MLCRRERVEPIRSWPAPDMPCGDAACLRLRPRRAPCRPMGSDRPRGLRRGVRTTAPAQPAGCRERAKTASDDGTSNPPRRRRPVGTNPAKHGRVLERVKGIEPSSGAWEALALPLSYTRLGIRITPRRDVSSSERAAARRGPSGRPARGPAAPQHPVDRMDVTGRLPVIRVRRARGIAAVVETIGFARCNICAECAPIGRAVGTRVIRSADLAAFSTMVRSANISAAPTVGCGTPRGAERA